MRRWPIVVASVVMQMALGAFYTWSVFRIPLAKQFGWSISQIALAFTLSVLGLGFGCFWGGLLMNRTGPRVAAWLGGFLWGTGVFLASFSGHRLWWLYLSYGVIGGSGLGCGYIVPVAVLVKWFPDRRGLMTGLAVGGFGGGTLVVAPIATRLIERVGPMPTFAYLGIGYLVVTLIAASFMKNPPVGWTPEGWTPTAKHIAQRAAKDYTLAEALKTRQFWALCALLSLNSIAGISVASQAAPIFQEMGKVTAVMAATMVGIASITNGGGRIFWAWVSDLTTRKTALFVMFLVQAILFWAFAGLDSAILLGIVASIILSCYGGGYGVMPAFAADYFGAKNVSSIFGLMMIPWAFAAAFGPLLFAYMRQISGGYGGALHVMAAVMAVSMILPIVVSPPR
jgi:OFA family oxalate/formate antiporter-like MFS transporter